MIDCGSEITTFVKWNLAAGKSTKFTVVNSYFINKVKRRTNIAPRKQQERRQSSQIVAGKKLNKIEMSVCVVKRPQEASPALEFSSSASLSFFSCCRKTMKGILISSESGFADCRSTGLSFSRCFGSHYDVRNKGEEKAIQLHYSFVSFISQPAERKSEKWHSAVIGNVYRIKKKIISNSLSPL